MSKKNPNSSDDPPTIADLEVHGLSRRIINFLEEELGLLYVDQLRSVTASMLLERPGFGRGSLEQVRAALRHYLNGTIVKTEQECLVSDDETE